MTPRPPRFKTLPFPAASCRFFVHGRCCLAEAPTCRPDASVQCEILSLWERIQDSALDMAEQCRLDGAGAAGLVAGSLRQAQNLELLCADYRPAGGEEALDCIFFHGHLCIRFMPTCPGVCLHYQNRRAGNGRNTP